jgi:hypothetical protein
VNLTAVAKSPDDARAERAPGASTDHHFAHWLLRWAPPAEQPASAKLSMGATRARLHSSIVLGIRCCWSLSTPPGSGVGQSGAAQLAVCAQQRIVPRSLFG